MGRARPAELATPLAQPRVQERHHRRHRSHHHSLSAEERLWRQGTRCLARKGTVVVRRRLPRARIADAAAAAAAATDGGPIVSLQPPSSGCGLQLVPIAPAALAVVHHRPPILWW